MEQWVLRRRRKSKELSQYTITDRVNVSFWTEGGVAYLKGSLINELLSLPIALTVTPLLQAVLYIDRLIISNHELLDLSISPTLSRLVMSGIQDLGSSPRMQVSS